MQESFPVEIVLKPEPIFPLRQEIGKRSIGGLMNHGTNCYMNSGLRFILQIDKFKNFLRKEVFSTTLPLAVELKKILKQLDDGCCNVEMKHLIKAWGWSQCEQHDAAEFIDSLITKLDEELMQKEWREISRDMNILTSEDEKKSLTFSATNGSVVNAFIQNDGAIYALPRNLIIHVNRADIDGESKVFAEFTHPLQVDFGTVVLRSSMIYALQAVVAQAGNARMGNTRNASFIKEGIKWFEVNDTLSKEVTKEEIESLSGVLNFAATSLLYVLK